MPGQNNPNRGKLFQDPSAKASAPAAPTPLPTPPIGGSMRAMLAARGAGAGNPPVPPRRPAGLGGQTSPSGGPPISPATSNAPIYSVMQQPWLDRLFGGGAIAPPVGRSPKRG